MITDKPCAVPGLTSFRYRGTYGWVMIGAKDYQDALNEAQRSINTEPVIENLQIWKDWTYLPVVAVIRQEIENLRFSRSMLENKSFRINIRPEQDRIDNQISVLKGLLK